MTDKPLLRREAHPAITHCDNCGCDWLDNGLNPVGCPYCKLSAETEALRGAMKEVDFFTPGARLALELECLLMDTRDAAAQSRWWASAHEALEQWRQAVREMEQAIEADNHPDSQAVDRFAAAMKEKLAQARAKGRSGWQNLPSEELSRMLREHVEKGDPLDVANFCMFLWNLGHGIGAALSKA